MSSIKLIPASKAAIHGGGGRYEAGAGTKPKMGLVTPLIPDMRLVHPHIKKWGW